MSNSITCFNKGIGFPSLLGRHVFDDVFSDLFLDFPQHLRNSTSGYPVADIYRNDEGSTVIEFALAGFSKEDLSIDIQPTKRSITVSAKNASSDKESRRIARRSFNKTYVNYDNNLDLHKIAANYMNGLLTIVVPTKEEAKPLSVNIK